MLIAAAGTASRFGSTLPKPYVNFCGGPLLRRTLGIFLSLRDVASLRVIIHPDHIGLYEGAVQGLDLPPPIMGGSTRKQSIYYGLKSFSNPSDEDKILIHDAARPLVRPADILSLSAALQDHPSISLAAPVVDTLTRHDGSYVDRSGLYALQTPQGFALKALLAAHEKAGDRDFPDDTSLFQAATGIAPHLVMATGPNFKITTQQDLPMAEALLSSPAAFSTRIGTGFDVHAFDTGGDHVVLGGVRIPHSRALQGHSDADVALHALTDAILGALGDGDIGVHFPPSDPSYKGMDSAHFLKFAAERARQRDGTIENVDLTIICESPKISPHASAMRQNIARILDLPLNRIGLKATTTEGLGFTGRGEGIAAQAVASLKLPV